MFLIYPSTFLILFCKISSQFNTEPCPLVIELAHYASQYDMNSAALVGKTQNLAKHRIWQNAVVFDSGLRHDETPCHKIEHFIIRLSIMMWELPFTLSGPSQQLEVSHFCIITAAKQYLPLIMFFCFRFTYHALSRDHLLITMEHCWKWKEISCALKTFKFRLLCKLLVYLRRHETITN